MSKIVIYPGGKHYMCDWILPLFPKHVRYVDVFGGSGTFIFKKKRSKIEIYNDLNDDMFNFFKVLRDKPDELYSRVKYVPCSRSMFEEYAVKMKEGTWKDDVDRAVAVMYLSRFAFSGKWQLGKPHFSTPDRNSVNEHKYWENLKGRVGVFASRFNGVVIECLDFKELIKKYDASDTFFYCDPPYIDESKGFYKHSFTWQDHVDLATLLKGIEGKFMISYTSSDKVKVLYDGCHFAERSFTNYLNDIKAGQDRERRVEMIATNYEIVENATSGQTRVI